MSETSEYEKQILGKRQQNKNKLAELGLTPVLKHDIAKKSKEPKYKWPRTVAQHKKFTNPTAPKRSSDRLNRSTESAPSRSKKQQQKEFIVLDPSTICPPEQTVRHYHLKLMKTFERLYPMLLSGEIDDMIKAQYAEMRARAAEIRRALNEAEEGAKDELQRESRDPESGEANTRAPETKNRKKRRIIGSDSRRDNNANNNINRNNVSSNEAGSQHSGGEDSDAEMRDVADEEHGENDDASGYQDNDETAQYKDYEEGADDESNDERGDNDNDEHSQDEQEKGERIEDEESDHDQGKPIASSLRSHHAARRRVRDSSESSEPERSPDNFEFDDNYEQSSSQQGVSSESSESSEESGEDSESDGSASDSDVSSAESALSSNIARSRGMSNSDEASGSAESES